MNTVNKRIRVTKEDIKYGNRRESTSCPIARAICRLVKDNVFVSVGRRSHSIGDITEENIDKMQEFTRAFDYAEPVEPCTFIIKVNKKDLR